MVKEYCNNCNELIELNEMEKAIDNMESQEIYKEWRSLSLSLGKRVRISSAEGDLLGQVVDLDGDGALILQQGRENRRILAGDCIHLRPEGRDSETQSDCRGDIL